MLGLEYKLKKITIYGCLAFGWRFCNCQLWIRIHFLRIRIRIQWIRMEANTYLSWVFQLGENIWYFPPLCLYFCPCVFIFPRVFIFSLLGHAINCSSFAGGVLGENILCLCFPPGHAVWYLFYLSS
jgi:hypothetical protein